LHDKCEQASKDVETELKDKKDEQKEWEEQFYDLEEKITDLEGKNSESQSKISEQIDELKTNSNEIVQRLKDDMGNELKQIDDQISKLEQEIASLKEQLDKLEETRMTVFYNKRKQQNEMYSKCFATALERTEKERSAYYAKKTSNTLKRKSMGSLMGGVKAQTKNIFAGKFNSYLNLCLNNQAALLQKKNTENEYKLAFYKLNRQEKRAKAKIAQIRQQIESLKTSSKADVLNKFKAKMEAELNRFNQAYDTSTKNHQRNSQQIIAEIQKIKQKQSYALNNRAQAVPQKTRSLALAEQCSNTDAFNLFSSEDFKERGIFNSSPSSYSGSGTVY